MFSAITCGTPPAIDNTTRLWDGFLYTNTTTYSCEEGFAINQTHPDGRNFTTECTEYGNWSVPVDYCGGGCHLLLCVMAKLLIV